MGAISRFRIAVDIGGTFTDIALLTDTGLIHQSKISSTPADPSIAVVEGVAQLLAELSIDPSAVAEVLHGTTVGSNTILQRKGARTGLITTRGFRDVLEIGRIRMPDMFDLTWDKPAPLVPRRHRLEGVERMAADGSVVEPLSEASVVAAGEALMVQDIEAVAIAFINSYRNPAHELEAAAILRARFPKFLVTTSCAVLPEMKEYERTSTTVVNAYLLATMREYLQRLQSGLRDIGVKAPILVMTSNGGMLAADVTCEKPVMVVASGPAGGVVGAARLGIARDDRDVIVFDMGGTTAKAVIIEDGRPTMTSEYEFRDGISTSSRFIKAGGYMLKVPAIDIAEVGAGGGSLAGIDQGGLLVVGPQSAGAMPGPACYGLGNDRPTVTDANVVLGYIRPGKLADGEVTIDALAAKQVIQDKIATPLGMGLLEAAEGIHRIANARIMRALRAVSSQRGRDPRDYALMAFGGSGPIHAANLAQELQIRTVIIPPLPGLFSAIGLLSSGVEHHDVRSCLLAVDFPNLEQIEQICVELRTKMLAQFRNEGFATEDLAFKFAADIRFEGQSSEVRVNLEDESLNQSSQKELRSKFEHEYERLYGHLAEPGNPIEIVALRLVGRVTKAATVTFRPAAMGEASHPQRYAYFGREIGFIETPVIARDALVKTRQGPLLIDEYDSTIVVPPFMQARIDKDLNIVMEPHSA